MISNAIAPIRIMLNLTIKYFKLTRHLVIDFQSFSAQGPTFVPKPAAQPLPAAIGGEDIPKSCGPLVCDGPVGLHWDHAVSLVVASVALGLCQGSGAEGGALKGLQV